MTTIPDFMPRLRKGIGSTPADGGCLVQVASFLSDGMSWTDKTPCVHPVLRALAITVNDRTPDTHRPKLAPLAADLVGTAGPDGLPGKVLSVRLAAWCARQVLREGDTVSLAAVEAAEAWADKPCEETRVAAYTAYSAATAAYAADAAATAAYAAAYAADAAATAAYAAAASGSDLHDLLAGAIAEHRRLTGHVPAPVDPERAQFVLDTLGTAT